MKKSKIRIKQLKNQMKKKKKKTKKQIKKKQNKEKFSVKKKKLARARSEKLTAHSARTTLTRICLLPQR